MKSINISVERHSVNVVSFVHESHYCILCGDVLANPQQAPCGCRFCLDCITDYLKYAERVCPGKTEDCVDVKLNLERDLRLDVLAKREISKLMVKCCFESCDRECELREMKDHLDLCASVIVQCGLCDRSVSRGEYEDHKTSDCPEAEVDCIACHRTMTKRELSEQHLSYDHDLLCAEFSDYCPNECGEKNEVVWIEHRRMCKKKITCCPYQAIGCPSNNLTVGHLPQHMLDKGFEHAEVLLKHIENLNNEIDYLKSTISSVTNENVIVTNKCGQQARAIEKLNEKIEAMNSSIEGIKEDNLRAFREVNIKIKTEIAASIRGQNSTQSLTINQMNGDLVRMKQEVETMRKTNMPMKEVRDKMYKCGSENKEPTFVWRVHDFTTIHNLSSPYFHTHPGGYKLTLRIEKMTKGYMSLYVQLHRGDSDEDLSWPFRKSITVQIVDQEKLGRDFEKVVLFNEKAGCVCERKYFAETGDYGHSKFISYQELREKTYLMMDNKMRIRCFVNELNVLF